MCLQLRTRQSSRKRAGNIHHYYMFNNVFSIHYSLALRTLENRYSFRLYRNGGSKFFPVHPQTPEIDVLSRRFSILISSELRSGSTRTYLFVLIVSLVKSNSLFSEHLIDLLLNYMYSGCNPSD